jgi:hypothetical protein
VGDSGEDAPIALLPTVTPSGSHEPEREKLKAERTLAEGKGVSVNDSSYASGRDWRGLRAVASVGIVLQKSSSVVVKGSNMVGGTRELMRMREGRHRLEAR